MQATSNQSLRVSLLRRDAVFESIEGGSHIGLMHINDMKMHSLRCGEVIDLTFDGIQSELETKVRLKIYPHMRAIKDHILIHSSLYNALVIIHDHREDLVAQMKPRFEKCDVEIQPALMSDIELIPLETNLGGIPENMDHTSLLRQTPLPIGPGYLVNAWVGDSSYFFKTLAIYIDGVKSNQKAILSTNTVIQFRKQYQLRSDKKEIGAEISCQDGGELYGVEELQRDVVSYLGYILRMGSFLQSTNLLAITSEPGCGKTHFLEWMKVQFIQKYQDVPTHYVDELEDLNRILSLASVEDDCMVVVIDDLDQMMTREIPEDESEDHGDKHDQGKDSNHKILQQICEHPKILLVATFNKGSALLKWLSKRFPSMKLIELPFPSKTMKRQIVGSLIKKSVGHSDSMSRNDRIVRFLIEETPGYSYRDIISIMRDCSSAIKQGDEITNSLLERSLQRIRPSLREIVETSIPSRSLSDYGGFSDQVNAINKAINWALRDFRRLQDMGITPCRGILIHGPSGSGKSALATAVCGSNKDLAFIEMKSTQVFSKYLGESEAKIREHFRAARRLSPCIVFIDDIDIIGKSRTGGQGGGGSANLVGDRVLTQLLTEMDGVSDSAPVFVVACTNRKEIIDAALLRPGRFDEFIELGPIRKKEDSLEILKISTRGMRLSHDVDLDIIAARSVGHLAGKISSLARTAGLMSLRRDQDAQHVSHDDFLACFPKDSIATLSIAFSSMNMNQIFPKTNFINPFS